MSELGRDKPCPDPDCEGTCTLQEKTTSIAARPDDDAAMPPKIHGSVWRCSNDSSHDHEEHELFP